MTCSKTLPSSPCVWPLPSDRLNIGANRVSCLFGRSGISTLSSFELVSLAHGRQGGKGAFARSAALARDFAVLRCHSAKAHNADAVSSRCKCSRTRSTTQHQHSLDGLSRPKSPLPHKNSIFSRPFRYWYTDAIANLRLKPSGVPGPQGLAIRATTRLSLEAT